MGINYQAEFEGSACSLCDHFKCGNCIYKLLPPKDRWEDETPKAYRMQGKCRTRVCSREYNHDKHQMEDTPKPQYAVTLQSLYNAVMQAVNTARLNHKDLSEVKVLIEDNDHLRRGGGPEFLLGGTFKVGHREGLGSYLGLEVLTDHILDEIALDERPEEGEYFSSRGVGYDLAGYIKSKAAGERILELVKGVLGVAVPKSYLDFREYEPTYIQFKFQPEEFDLEKLDKMTRDAGRIITHEILVACKL